jgi:hypothetical protein
MRIKFCYSAFGQFGGQLRRKYDLQRINRNIVDPCIFYGLYGSQVDRILAHEGLSIAMWAGSDAPYFIKDTDRLARFKAKPNIRVIARSDYIARDMDKVGIKYIKLPVLAVNNSDIVPCPLGDSMYIYRPTSKKYRSDITQEIRRRLPHIHVIEGNPHRLDRNGILNVYRQCFVSIRPISHDGCSNGVAEMGLMGRPSIWNGGAPHCISWDTIDDIEREVVNLYNNRKNHDWENTAKVAYDYYDIGEGFLNTEFYE